MTSNFPLLVKFNECAEPQMFIFMSWELFGTEWDIKMLIAVTSEDHQVHW